MSQTTSNILMIQPVGFRYNEQTALNNYYQKAMEQVTPENVQQMALNEFNAMVVKLKQEGINVLVIPDTASPDTPDSIFPNNWVSFHSDGRIALYPMFAENRRLERREDILDALQNEHGFQVSDIIDFTEFEEHNAFLEGTGSLVLDRTNKIAYAALSVRTDKKAVELFCEEFDYTAVVFTANQTVNGNRMPIYHTNVMMSVGKHIAIVCFDSIDDVSEQLLVRESLEESQHTIVEISEAQKEHFAGNMLEVQNSEGDAYMVMSTAAYKSLTPQQIEAIEQHCTIIHSDIPTIEACGGGSARCMMAELFLPKL